MNNKVYRYLALDPFRDRQGFQEPITPVPLSLLLPIAVIVLYELPNIPKYAWPEELSYYQGCRHFSTWMSGNYKVVRFLDKPRTKGF